MVYVYKSYVSLYVLQWFCFWGFFVLFGYLYCGWTFCRVYKQRRRLVQHEWQRVLAGILAVVVARLAGEADGVLMREGASVGEDEAVVDGFVAAELAGHGGDGLDCQ